MKLSPDGRRYLAASDQRVARPFHYRWMMPLVCGRRLDWWTWQSRIAVGACAVLCGIYTRSWAGAVLPLGLAGVTKINLRLPVLVDAMGMAFALGAAVCWQHGWYIAAVAVVLVGATVKESAPVFAALYAWSPVLLVGLVAVAARSCLAPGDDVLDQENRWILQHPFAASRKYHANLKLWLCVLPWGACLAGLAHPTWQVAACLAVAYGQCLVATDTVRLYQWAFPVLALNAVANVPVAWWLPLLALHLANPFATEGA